MLHTSSIDLIVSNLIKNTVDLRADAEPWGNHEHTIYNSLH